MDFYNYSWRKKGGIVGAVCAVLGFFAALFGFLKSFIIDGWDGISHTAGNSIANIVGWVFIYGFLALMLSAIIFAALLIVLFPLGFFIGWLYGKIR